MLSSREIAELEKKYSKYIIRKIFKISIFTLIFFSIIAALFYLFIFENTTKKSLPKEIEKNTTITKKDIKNPSVIKSDSNSSIKIKSKNLHTATEKTNDIKEKNSTAKTISKNDKQIINLTQETNTTENIEKNSTLDRQNLLLKDNEAPKNLNFKLQPSNTIYTNHENTGRLKFHFAFKKAKHRKNSQIAPAPLQNANDDGIIMEDENKKAKIDIEISDINSIQYLKDKLQKTHDISFALMLCKNYYSKKDFKNSLKWSIIANDMDSQNAKSWIWFAKSKYRLNKRDDAIKALKAFLKSNDSEEVRSLLRNIINGEMDD